MKNIPKDTRLLLEQQFGFETSHERLTTTLFIKIVDHLYASATEVTYRISISAGSSVEKEVTLTGYVQNEQTLIQDIGTFSELIKAVPKHQAPGYNYNTVLFNLTPGLFTLTIRTGGVNPSLAMPSQ